MFVTWMHVLQPLHEFIFFSTLQTDVLIYTNILFMVTEPITGKISLSMSLPLTLNHRSRSSRSGLGIVWGKGGATWRLFFATVWNWGLEVFSGKSYLDPIPCNSLLIILLSVAPATWASRLSCTHKWCFWAEFVAGKTGLNSSQTRWCRFSQ